MRPSPLVLLALVAMGLALIAVPLARLTGSDGYQRAPIEARGQPAGTTAETAVASLIRIRFAHPPLEVTLSQDGRPIARFPAPDEPADGTMEQQTTMNLPIDGLVDLLVEATWTEGTPPTALGVEVEPDGYETRRTTAWTDGGALAEWLTFSWK
jgi:hypothetical protein